MSTETKVKCDRCGHSFIEGAEDRRSMYTVSIIYQHGIGKHLYSHTTRSEANVGKADWCEDCCKQTGIWRPRKKPNEPMPEPLTIEDLVREIIYEHVSERI